jgi:hypothetical protein
MTFCLFRFILLSALSEEMIQPCVLRPRCCRKEVRTDRGLHPQPSLNPEAETTDSEANAEMEIETIYRCHKRGPDFSRYMKTNRMRWRGLSWRDACSIPMIGSLSLLPRLVARHILKSRDPDNRRSSSERRDCGRSGQPFDMFQTQAICPHCAAGFAVTSCSDCGGLNPMSEDCSGHWSLLRRSRAFGGQVSNRLGKQELEPVVGTIAFHEKAGPCQEQFSFSTYTA